MIRYYTLGMALFLALSGMTQPVISNMEPAIGDQFLYTQADNTDYTHRDAGADVFWDFSGLYAQVLNDLSYSILPPSAGEENATSVWCSNFEISNDRHIYRSFGSDLPTTYGSVIVSSIANAYGRKYNTPEEGLTFPVSYQDEGSDTYDGMYVSELFGTEKAFIGNTAYVIDGYGTIETQYGVFENILPVTTTEVEQVVVNTFNGYLNTRSFHMLFK